MAPNPHHRLPLLLTLVLCAFVAACGSGEKPKKNVVCILVDQLRKDAADREWTKLNDLAAQGIVVENMRSVAPWTYPSVVSMFSGLYPQQHGATGHLTQSRLTTFDTEVPLVPKILQEEGYRTAAFVANPFLHTWNPFHEGFHNYDIQFINSQGNLRGLGDVVWNPDRMFANSINKALFEHFDERPHERPEFTYIHYIDVHGPWEGAPFRPNYDASVRYIEERILEVYDYFMERYDGEVLFLITSDHGQSQQDDETVGFGKPWRKNKASVHDFNLRIPFLILPSKMVEAPAVVEEPCVNIDFTPTVLEWVDVPSPEPIPGISLLPAIRGGSIPGHDRPLYARMSAFKKMNDGIVYQNKKYVRHFDINTRELTHVRVFDLDGDPRETMSLSGDLGDAMDAFRDAAGMHGRKYEARFDSLDPELKRKLQAMGYL